MERRATSTNFNMDNMDFKKIDNKRFLLHWKLEWLKMSETLLKLFKKTREEVYYEEAKKYLKLAKEYEENIRGLEKGN